MNDVDTAVAFHGLWGDDDGAALPWQKIFEVSGEGDGIGKNDVDVGYHIKVVDGMDDEGLNVKTGIEQLLHPHGLQVVDHENGAPLHGFSFAATWHDA